MSDKTEWDTAFTAEGLPVLDGGALTGPLLMPDWGPPDINLGPIHITFGEPLHIEVDQDVSYSGAAKLFLNEVARLLGQEPPFGW